jgi:hypothetical protein
MQVVARESGGVHTYNGKLPCTSNGRIGVKVRVTPFLGVGISQHAMGLVAWSN